MFNARSLAAVVWVPIAILAGAARAEPVTLKAAFFSSERSTLYRATMAPFIDAVNTNGAGLVNIVAYTGGILGRDMAQQPQVVRTGIADIGYIVPGYTRDLFPDNAVVELPGVFRNAHEATLTYTRLIARGKLRGYEDFVVIGAYVTQPESFHSLAPISNLEDIKGKRIRVNNPMAATVLESLGALPVPLGVNQIATAMADRTIDAALIPMTPLSDYGVKRIALHHYLLGTSGAPLAVVMNRKKFESLSEPARALLLRYAGEWAAARFVEVYDGSDQAILAQLTTEPNRKVIHPSAEDRSRASAAFDAVITKWVSEDNRNIVLLKSLQAELAGIRGE